MCRIWIITFLIFYVSLCSCGPCRIVEIPSIFMHEGLINVIVLTNESCHVCSKLMTELSDVYQDLNAQNININIIIGNKGSSDYLPDIDGDISFNNNKIWDILDGEAGDVYIFDRCGRMAYAVINPYNELKYITAAILTVFYDNPCGDCPEENPLRYKEAAPEIPTFPEFKSSHEEDEVIIPNDDGTVPMNLISQIPHYHKGDPRKHEFLELKTGDPLYHGHLETEQTDKESYSPLRKHFLRYEVMPQPHQSITNQESDDGDEDDASTGSEEESIALKLHYQKILKWINCSANLINKQLVND